KGPWRSLGQGAMAARAEASPPRRGRRARPPPAAAGHATRCAAPARRLRLGRASHPDRDTLQPTGTALERKPELCETVAAPTNTEMKVPAEIRTGRYSSEQYAVGPGDVRQLPATTPRGPSRRPRADREATGRGARASQAPPDHHGRPG